MRKYYWYITAYAKKHGPIMLVSVIVAVFIFWFGVPSLLKAFDQKRRVYIGMIGQYSLENLPDPVANLISAGLTTVEPDGTVSPSIAERWIVEDDGQSYRFVIKQNLVWQDGKPLIPSDLQYNFKDVETLTTQNDLIFKLPSAFVPFPINVAVPSFRYKQERYFLFFKRTIPIGIGAYRVVDYKEDGNKLTEIVLDGPTERLIYRFYFTEDEAVIAFKKGQVDFLKDISNNKYDIFNWPTVENRETIRHDRYLAAFFNNNSPLFPKNIRQALSYALPKPTDLTRAIGPISPDSWVYLDSAKDYAFDEDRALERILDGIPTQPLEFTLTTTALFQDEAETVKKAWEDFGKKAIEACQKSKNISDKDSCQNLSIAVQIRVTNFPDTNSFDVLLVGQEIPPDPDQYTLWHSEQQTNFTHFKNTRIDALLERGRTTADAKERQAIYQEFQQFFLEDAPAVFIRYLPSYDVLRKGLVAQGV